MWQEHTTRLGQSNKQLCLSRFCIQFCCVFFPAIFMALLNNENVCRIKFCILLLNGFFLVLNWTFLSVLLLKLLASLGNNLVASLMSLLILKQQRNLSLQCISSTFIPMFCSHHSGVIFGSEIKNGLPQLAVYVHSFSNSCYQTGNLISLPQVAVLNRKT